jgi:hypothetical protein
MSFESIPGSILPEQTSRGKQALEWRDDRERAAAGIDAVFQRCTRGGLATIFGGLPLTVSSSANLDRPASVSCQRDFLRERIID